MVISSSSPTILVPEVGFSEYMFGQIRGFGNKVALVDAATGEELTYHDIFSLSVKLASSLTRRGLDKQEIIAVCIANNIYYSVVILGIAACNAIVSPCNPNYTYSELVKQFELCQPKYIITDSNQVDKMLKVAEVIPSVKQVLSMDCCDKCTSIRDLIKHDDGKEFPTHVEIDPHEDIVLLPYSSGTTGLPKGVMLTHYNVVALQVLARGTGKMPPWNIHYSVLPMFHAYGLLYQFLVMNGMKHVIAKRFNVEHFCQAVEKYKITSVGGAPPILIELSKSEVVEKYDMSSLMMIGSGAASLSPNVAMQTMMKLRALIVQGWGLTECTVLTSVAMPGAPIDSVGFLCPNTRLKVVHPETGKELGVNEDGELWVKGPQVMKGYYKNPEQTSNVFDAGGWFRTGDIGHYDHNNMVFIVDRLKELIKYKGFQVAPAELESVLLGHPLVEDAGVCGVPDPQSGEIPRAFVVRSDPDLTEKELREYVEEHVSKYKYLRGGIVFVKEIPKTTTGKILRRELRQLSDSHKAKL